MTTNPHFNHTTYTNTQDLIQDLCTESIIQRGVDVLYIRREDFSPDFLFDEPHSITNYKEYIEIEMIVSDFSGGSHNDLFEKFGLEINDTLTLQVSIERFKEEITPIMGINKPDIGDLVYLPYTGSVYEIKRVYYGDQDASTIYQRGKNYFHSIELELFTPNTDADVFDTDIGAIDDGYNVDVEMPSDDAEGFEEEDSNLDIISDFDPEKFQF